MTEKKDQGRTASGKSITDDLINELAAKAEAGYEVEVTTLPDGYLLPEGMTMGDVRRLDLELLGSDGLKIEALEADDSRKDESQPQQ